MRVRLVHVTRLEYTGDVMEGVMDVRLGPFSDAHQRWDRFALTVTPAGSVQRYTDGFGNAAHLVSVARPHQLLEVVTRSDVVTTLENPFEPPPEPPAPLGISDLADFLSPSALVPAHPTLARMAEPYRPSTPEGTFDAVGELSRLVHRSFTYQRNVTSVTTTVTEALELLTGVCQDYSHVLIGLCRAIGVPARYVSGYTVADGTPGRPTRGDAEASHAWVEAFTPTHGWRGFDPTNDLVAGPAHVKVALGRDYADVPPTRGSFRGSATEQLTVRVESRPVD